MTFPELFAKHGYFRICEVCDRVVHPNGRPLSKAHLANIWYGHDRLGANLARLLSASLGIPLAELLSATPAERPGRGGRRRDINRHP